MAQPRVGACPHPEQSGFWNFYKSSFFSPRDLTAYSSLLDFIKLVGTYLIIYAVKRKRFNVYLSIDYLLINFVPRPSTAATLLTPLGYTHPTSKFWLLYTLLMIYRVVTRKPHMFISSY